MNVKATTTQGTTTTESTTEAHPYAGVKGTRRCECGRGATAQVHRAWKLAQATPVQATPVEAPAVEAPAQVAQVEPAPGKAHCTVTGFSAHSRRPAECRFCGSGREAAHHAPAAVAAARDASIAAAQVAEAPAQVDAPAEAPAQVGTVTAPNGDRASDVITWAPAPAGTYAAGAMYADRRAEAARLLAEARELATEARDAVRLASEQIDTPRFSPFRGVVPMRMVTEADTLATWATDAPADVAPAGMPWDVAGRAPAEATTEAPAPARRKVRAPRWAVAVGQAVAAGALALVGSGAVAAGLALATR